MKSNLSELQRLFPFMDSSSVAPANMYSRSYAKIHPSPNAVEKNPLIMVFDVETTGLLPCSANSYCKPSSIESLESVFSTTVYPTETVEPRPIPHIIQLSYVIYDVAKHETVKMYNNYIELPEGFLLSDEITKITGITQEMCEQRGIDIELGLLEFAEDYRKCGTIVSHNLDFDRAMIRVEMARHWSLGLSKTVFNEEYQKKNAIETYCTMKNGIDICNLYRERKPSPNSKNPTKTWKYKKMPKLVELYQELFGSVPANLHNSLIDTLVCMRCYLKMRHDIHFKESDFCKWLMDSI